MGICVHATIRCVCVAGGGGGGGGIGVCVRVNRWIKHVRFGLDPDSPGGSFIIITLSQSQQGRGNTPLQVATPSTDRLQLATRYISSICCACYKGLINIVVRQLILSVFDPNWKSSGHCSSMGASPRAI